jgi:hypothetical protein
MLEPQAREIDGLAITVQPLPAMRAFKLLHKILKAVAPSAAKALASGDLKNISFGSLSEAAEILFDRLSEEDLAAVTRQLLDMAFVTSEGEQRPARNGDVLHAAFDGRMGALIKVIGFALEVNYGDFLAVLKSAAKKLPAKGSPSAPPTESSKPGAVTDS